MIDAVSQLFQGAVIDSRESLALLAGQVVAFKGRLRTAFQQLAISFIHYGPAHYYAHPLL